MDFEDKVSTIKTILVVHNQVANSNRCWCGWRSEEFKYADHLAATIAARVS